MSKMRVSSGRPGNRVGPWALPTGPLRRAMVVAASSLATVVGLSAIGCVKQDPSLSTPPQVKTAPGMEIDPDLRVHELQEQSGQFMALVHTLPGATPQENREKLKQAFASLSKILPLAQVGPHGGVFDHQITVVDLTRSELATGSNDLSIVPIVDRGMRAVYNALDDAQHNSRFYSDDAPLRATLDQLTAKIAEFDTVQGARHDQAWADAFNLTSDAIDRMATVLAKGLVQGGASAPATGPADSAPASTTAPATMPNPG